MECWLWLVLAISQDAFGLFMCCAFIVWCHQFRLQSQQILLEVTSRLAATSLKGSDWRVESGSHHVDKAWQTTVVWDTSVQGEWTLCNLKGVGNPQSSCERDAVWKFETRSQQWDTKTVQRRVRNQGFWVWQVKVIGVIPTQQKDSFHVSFLDLSFSIVFSFFNPKVHLQSTEGHSRSHPSIQLDRAIRLVPISGQKVTDILRKPQFHPR